MVVDPGIRAKTSASKKHARSWVLTVGYTEICRQRSVDVPRRRGRRDGGVFSAVGDSGLLKLERSGTTASAGRSGSRLETRDGVPGWCGHGERRLMVHPSWSWQVGVHAHPTVRPNMPRESQLISSCLDFFNILYFSLCISWISGTC